MATLNGIDISAHQPNITISKLTTTDFVIVKATEGTQYANPYMTNHANAVLVAGKLLGLYHFARGESHPGTAAEEAKHFVDAIRPYIGKAVLALDWEKEAYDQGESWALSWLNTVKRLTGVSPIFYCQQSTLASKQYSKIAAAGYKLWLTQYPNYETQHGYRDTPWRSGGTGAFNSYVMHQYTSCGRITGYSANLDLDKYYGGVSDWKALCAASSSKEESTTVSYYIANACNGDTGITGGKLGDNTGKEVKIQTWYSYPWDTVLRAYSAEVAEDIASAMELGCKNDNIGYDQSNRTSLYTAMAALGWNAANMAKVGLCETDCSAMVAVAVNCAGIKVSKNIYTGNEVSALLATGEFYKVVDTCLTNPAYLRRGDILINTKNHTAVAMDTGSKAAARLSKSGASSSGSSASATVDYSPSVAKGYQAWENGTGKTLTVYAESYQATAIGSLDDGDTGYCFGKVWDSEAADGAGAWMWSVAYHPNSHPKGWKEGYVTDSGGCTF